MPYEPATWNNNSVTVRHNNCYNYAVNYISDTFAQPGRISHYKIGSQISCGNTTLAAISDGMIVISDCHKKTEYYKIALVIAPDTPKDYHWYRMQTYGRKTMWGHKPGSTKVIDTDASGLVITDPKTCNRNNSPNGGPNYKDFCGYYFWPVCTPVK